MRPAPAGLACAHMLGLAFAYTSSVVFTRVGIPITERNRFGAGFASPTGLARARKLLDADIDALATIFAGIGSAFTVRNAACAQRPRTIRLPAVVAVHARWLRCWSLLVCFTLAAAAFPPVLARVWFPDAKRNRFSTRPHTASEPSHAVGLVVN